MGARILTPFVPSPLQTAQGEGKRFLWMFNPGLRAGAALTLG
jgi:hypothetical protein